MKKVILSTSPNINYSVYAPLTTLVWKKITGYDPLIILVTDNMNKPTEYAMNCARDLGAEIHEISAVKDYNPSTSAQTSRIFVGCLDLPDDTYCLTSDMDMWSLQKDYFNSQDWSKDVHIFFSNANNHKTYPICYLGMKHKIWREVIQVQKGNLTEIMGNQMKQDLGVSPDSTKEWQYDEYLFETRLRHWHGYKHKCQMMHRNFERSGLVSGRIDRASWREYNSGFVDSHVLRPLYFEQNWLRLRNLLKNILNDEDFNYCVNYHAKMLEETKGLY